jgi:sugar phosphate isomerase/epimerase
MLPTRRSLLAAAALSGLPARAARRIDLSRISVLTDECAKSPEDAIAFARQYKLKHVELRDVPGARKPYISLAEWELRVAARQIRGAGLRVSFLNTGMLKFTMPGTEPARARNESTEQRMQRLARERQRFEERLEELQRAIRAAEIFDVDIIRVFTFTRVENPASIMPEIARILKEMADLAGRARKTLLIENEGSCNVATSAELRQICEKVDHPALGINWDPMNAIGHKEEPFPDGYNLLPKAKVRNVQMKARGLVVGPRFLDWPAIFDALAQDRYAGKVGLETHVFDGTLIEKAHLAMEKLTEITRAQKT